MDETTKASDAGTATNNLQVWVNQRLQSESLAEQYVGLAVKVPVEIVLASILPGIVVFSAALVAMTLTPVALPITGVLSVEAAFTVAVYGKSVECMLSGDGPS